MIITKTKWPTDENKHFQEFLPPFFFGFSIPFLWWLPVSYVFVAESGDPYDRNEENDFISKDTISSKIICVDGEMYGFIYSKNNAVDCIDVCLNNPFSELPELSSLSDLESSSRIYKSYMGSFRFLFSRQVVEDV